MDRRNGHAEVSLWSAVAAVVAAVVVAPVVCLSRGLTNQDLRYGQKGRKEGG